MTTNISAEHRQAFEALTSGEYSNFALFSCFVDGVPAAAIVAVTREAFPGHGSGDADYVITPVFVSVTDQMTLTDHDGREPGAAP